jgi:hypothetical protein
MIAKAKKPVNVSVTINGMEVDKTTLRCSEDRAMWTMVADMDPFLSAWNIQMDKVFNLLKAQQEAHPFDLSIQP